MHLIARLQSSIFVTDRENKLTVFCLAAETAQAVAEMDFPQSDNTVRVKLLDTTTYLTGIAQVFVTPVAKGHETFNFKDVAFLIEHDGLGKKAMFDLGTRKDYWNSPPAVQALLGSDTAMTGVRVDKEVSEILEEGGVKLSSIGKYDINPLLHRVTTSLVR